MRLLFIIGSFLSVGAIPTDPLAKDMSTKPEREKEEGNAPAYWHAGCSNNHHYVGSFTLMMEWAECADYCQYFPHAGELGYTFQFADIMDSEEMECVRYNMEEQYHPGDGYAGHYWVGGYRGDDGMYKWHSGNPLTFTDFVGNPGAEPYIHLTPGNKYSWNTKNDHNDRNNGCLCKSVETIANVKASQCEEGWTDIGEKCVLLPYPILEMSWFEAQEFCQADLGGNLVEFSNYGEFFQLNILHQEQGVSANQVIHTWIGVEDFDHDEGDWRWASSDEPAFSDDAEYWADGQPDHQNHYERCAAFLPRGMLFDLSCDTQNLSPFCQKIKL